jgi:retinol dehydrogenase-12
LSSHEDQGRIRNADGDQSFRPFSLHQLTSGQTEEQNAPSRIVNVSSRAHLRSSIDLDDINYEKRPYSRVAAYADSKLANVLFTKELAKRLDGTGVTVYALHPGMSRAELLHPYHKLPIQSSNGVTLFIGIVRTELGRHIEDMVGPLKHLLWPSIYYFSKSSEEGAQTSIYCAVDESLSTESGKYYADCAEKEPQPLAKDPKLAERLWTLSEEAVGLTN